MTPAPGILFNPSRLGLGELRNRSQEYIISSGTLQAQPALGGNGAIKLLKSCETRECFRGALGFINQ